MVSLRRFVSHISLPQREHSALVMIVFRAVCPANSSPCSDFGRFPPGFITGPAYRPPRPGVGYRRARNLLPMHVNRAALALHRLQRHSMFGCFNHPAAKDHVRSIGEVDFLTRYQMRLDDVPALFYQPAVAEIARMSAWK